MNDKEKTLSLILDSARHEFADKGLYGANMQLIAKNAGVTKQLIHHYFGTKEELYTKVISDLADKSIAHLLSEDITGLEPVDALRKLLYSIFDFYSSNRCGPLVNQENMYAGANLHLHNKIYNLDAVISVFGNIVDAGEQKQVFKADINHRVFYVTANLIITGCFLNGHIMSYALNTDMTSESGLSFWREHATNYIINSIMV